MPALVRVMHVLHGSLMVPGWGRTIVGWVGVFMFVSCLTGIWLWWPITGSVRRGFRWKRQNSTNANLHHQIGFWVAGPAGDAELHRLLDFLPQRVQRVRGEPAQGQRRRPAGPRPRDARPAARADRD